MFAILRAAKLSSFGSISGSAKHAFRERETSNADGSKLLDNEPSGAASADGVLTAIHNRLNSVKVRKNAVLAVEYLLTASPKFFSDKEKDRLFFEGAQKWLEAKHGKENIVCTVVHRDETTPHMTAYVVPITPDGRLSATDYLDGRKKLSEMQTSFADAVKHLGLARGLEGSQANHTTVKDYYKSVNLKTPEIKTKIPEEVPATFSQIIAEKMGLETEYSKATALRETALEKRRDEIRERQNSIESKAKQYDLERANNASRNTRLAEMEENSLQLREMPLQTVFEHLGANKRDKDNWQTACGRVSTKDNKFYNHDTEKGGYGAIDLAMQQLDVSYKDAVGWLANSFGDDIVLSDLATKNKREIKVLNSPKIDYQTQHQREEKKWPQVKSYLVQQRGLLGSLVDSLYDEGKIYADKYANAVFALQGGGIALRGTGELPFHGVRGNKTIFQLEGRGKEIVLTESPIDAISLRQLGYQGHIVATIGSTAVKHLAAAYSGQGYSVVAAFDNDKAGEDMRQKIESKWQLVPESKDWNSDLKIIAKMMEKIPIDKKTLLIVGSLKEAKKQIVHCGKTNQTMPELRIIAGITDSIDNKMTNTYDEICIAHPESQAIYEKMVEKGNKAEKIIQAIAPQEKKEKERDYEMEID